MGAQSDWHYAPDYTARWHLWDEETDAGCPITRSLQLAGNFPPPVARAAPPLRPPPATVAPLQPGRGLSHGGSYGLSHGGSYGGEDALVGSFYDAIWVETEWYLPLLAPRHRRVLHAFGVAANEIRASCEAARAAATATGGENLNGSSLAASYSYSYDWLVMGLASEHKRLGRLVDKGGRRLAVTARAYYLRSGGVRPSAGQNLDAAAAARENSAETVRALLDDGVEVREFVPPDALPALLASARALLVPDAVWLGGGERAVLEARACGLAVEVAADNPRLASLAAGPVWNILYYAGQLEAGLLRVEVLHLSVYCSTAPQHECVRVSGPE